MKRTSLIVAALLSVAALATAVCRTWRSFGLAAVIALWVATAYGSNVTVDVGANGTLSYLPRPRRKSR